MLQWRFWAGRRDRLALALVGVLTLAIGLSVMSTLADSVRGTVAKAYEQTWRASYDILVHVPLSEGASLPDLTEPNVLTTLPPGITLSQWETVRQVPHVAVAAPLAVVGTLTTGPTYSIPSKEIPKPPNGLYRFRKTVFSADPEVPQVVEDQLLFAYAYGMEPDPAWPKDLLIVNGQHNARGVDGIGDSARIPVVLAGIDPESEAKLLGLDRTVTDGRYLSANESINWYTLRMSAAADAEERQWPSIPVMVNLHAFRGMSYTLAMEELNPDQTVKRVVYEQHWGPAELAKAMALGEKYMDPYEHAAVHSMLGRSGPISYVTATSPYPERWPAAVTVTPQPSDMQGAFDLKGFSKVLVDLGPSYRPWQRAEQRITPDKRIQNLSVSYQVIGYFDSSNLSAVKDPQTHMPLMTYRPAEALQVLDADSKPLNPPPTITSGISPVSFLSSPPALLTTIQGAVAVAGDGIINAIQVKVADTEHFTPETVARVRQIAQEIEQRTGLVAEVTMGSSPMNVLVQAPPSEGHGGFGWVELPWIHKNAGVTTVQQVEFGYSAFAVLILAVGMLYTMATALAGVTARRRELGVAVAVGWPRGAITRVVMGEQLLFGLATGLLAALAAELQGAPALKVGIVLAGGVAIYVPAALAASYAALKTAPGEALKWGDTAPSRRVLPGTGILPLALSSLMGRPVRTALTMAAVGLPTALLLVLTFITRQTGGVLYTTITGQYAALRAGPLQYTMGLIALGIAAVAAYDLVRQNAADHRNERALLHAIGWPRSWITLTMVAEGGLLGAAAGLLGDLVGVAVLGALYGPAVASAWQSALLVAALPLGLGLLTGAVVAMTELRSWGRAGLAGISEKQVARFGIGTRAVGAALLALATIALLSLVGRPILRGWTTPQAQAPAPVPSGPGEAKPALALEEAGGVKVWYPETMNKTIVAAALDRTRQAAALLQDRLGWKPEPMVVELLDTRPDQWGEYGEPIRLAATDASLPALLRELALKAIMVRSRNHAAGWLREGLAQYALDRSGYAGREAAFDLLRSAGPVPFERLATLPLGSAAHGEYERAVATARLLAAYLEARKGADAVGAALDELARSPLDPRALGPETYVERNQLSLSAVASVGGLALPALEQDFHTWLAQQSAAGNRPVLPVDPMPWMPSYSHAAPAVRTQYKLDVRLDPATLRLTGQQQVRFTNNGAVPLDSLYFHLFPNAPYFSKSGGTGSLTVQSVRVDGKPVPTSGGTDEILGFMLPAPLAPGAAVLLDLNWEATVPDVAGRYGVEGSSIFLGNFYPILAVHDEGGWHLDRYVDAGDPFYSEVADYDVILTVPTGFQVAATGHPTGPGRFTANNVRDFAAAASPDWQVYEQTVDGVLIRFYGNKKADVKTTPEASLAAAAGALHFFNEQFGPYPYQDLTVVNQSGMEYPGFVLATTVHEIVHEIGHQWWYGTVGNDEVRQIWDEGLTEFASLYYLSTIGQPKDQPISPGIGALDNTLYRYGAHLDGTASYPTAVYGRGWRLWEALRSAMGDTAFTGMVRAFYKQHQFGIATWADWREAVSKAGGKAAIEVFDGYVYSTELPAGSPTAVAPRKE